MILGVVFNLAILGFFKYTDFFIDTVNHVFKSNIPLLHILLPLGISFFTFQQISFIIDTYKGEVDKYNFIHYASFVAFFPQLIAGPIVTHDELIGQFRDESKKKIDFDNLTRGIFMFTIGLKTNWFLLGESVRSPVFGCTITRSLRSLISSAPRPCN